MQANEESVLVDNLQQGLDKMRTEKYALFADSAELDYHVRCCLGMFKGNFNSYSK